MTDDSRVLRPSEAAEELGIPPSTLRTYAFQFRSVLSPEAGAESPTGGPGFRHRRYTEADLATLRRAMDLLSDGLSYRSALVQLGRVAGVSLVRPSERRNPVRKAPRAPRVGHGPRQPRRPPVDDGPAAPSVVAPPIAEAHSAVEPSSPAMTQPSVVVETALRELLDRLETLEAGAHEQSRSIDRLEISLLEVSRAIHGLRIWLVSTLDPPPLPPAPPAPAPPDPPPAAPRQRGWLARLFGGDDGDGT